MCRIAAYIGAPIALEEIITQPSHSLLAQSQRAEEAKLAVNGDGFGISWYLKGKDRPGIYKDILPAWSNENLSSLSRMVESPLFIAHVRASTNGATSRENCHPFTHKNWSFCHNGQVPHLSRIRRRLEAELSDPLYAARKGTTDSELIFLTLLRHGLQSDVEAAWEKTVFDFRPSATEKPVRMTCVFSDGQTLYASRYSSDKKCPTLYVSEGPTGTIVASEPLTVATGGWRPIEPGKIEKFSGQSLMTTTKIA